MRLSVLSSREASASSVSTMHNLQPLGLSVAVVPRLTDWHISVAVAYTENRVVVTTSYLFFIIAIILAPS